MGVKEDPESIQPHAGDYQPAAWRDYTQEELEWWVRLLNKRAGMRTDPQKAEKDRYDAANYQEMLEALRREQQG